MSNYAVYEPNYRAKTKNIGIWLSCLSTILQRKDLLFYLVKRDFLSDYKRSFISVGWVLITPALGVASWLIINYTNILHPGDLPIPYPAYVLISTMIWRLFISIYQSTSNVFFESASFSLDVRYLREILIIKQIILQTLNLAVGLIFIEIVLIYYGIYPTWKILSFPFTLLPLILMGAGIGLLTSVYSVVLPDAKKWLDYGMQLLMFVTPVIYSPQVSNALIRKIILLNPISYLLDWSRASLIGGSFADPGKFLVSASGALLIFLAGLRLLYLAEDKVIEKI
ncbi:MAG: ABC transporter permease [Geobacteraceae bacterium]